MSVGLSEHDSEPVRGLPAELPAGEVRVWQGAPDWKSLAIRALHVRKIAIYFALLLALVAVNSLADGAPLPAAIAGTGRFAVLAAFALAMLLLLAWLMARTTVYTITNRRVVMRFGVALPMTVNVPFKIVAAAAHRSHGDGTGDISLSLSGEDRLSYLVLWPFARGWEIARPQPTLRCATDSDAAAAALAEALQSSALPRTAQVIRNDTSALA